MDWKAVFCCQPEVCRAIVHASTLAIMKGGRKKQTQITQNASLLLAFFSSCLIVAHLKACEQKQHPHHHHPHHHQSQPIILLESTPAGAVRRRFALSLPLSLTLLRERHRDALITGGYYLF